MFNILVLEKKISNKWTTYIEREFYRFTDDGKELFFFEMELK